jgi:hypothetical protein
MNTKETQQVMENKKKNIININLSGCKNMKECMKAIDMILSGKIQITIEKIK